MKLQGRDLTNGTRGDEVRLLHNELRLLGFRLIPDGETRPGIFGPHTLVAVREFQKEAGLRVTGIVDEATARAINEKVGTVPGEDNVGTGIFRIHGRVTTAAGSPLAGVTVRAFDRDLRSETLLGKVSTDAAGLYEVRYGPDVLRRAEKGSADIVVRVSTAEDSPLASSPILFNAPPDATVDVTIPAEVLPSPALFEAIGAALEPVLEGLRVAELEENEQHQDLTFLSGETGYDKSALARFGIAYKLARQPLSAEFWFALLGGSSFQYAETQSLATQTAAFLDPLPSLDAAAVRKALTRAFNEREIPQISREKVAGWVEAFLAFAASRLVSETAKPTLAKLALEDAGIKDPGKQQTFARLFNEHRALTPELLSALEREPSFRREEIADLRTSFQLADLTKADFSVVKMLKDELSVRRPEAIRTLAKRSQDEWVNLVRAKHAAGEITLPVEVGELTGQATLPNAEIYGKTLERQFREAYPTTAFAGGLERALQNGGARGLRHAAELGRFLERHESFELLNTSVDDFLENGVHPDLQALAQNEGFRLEVLAAQRVFKLAPSFEATDTLLADDLHSAQQIYRLGKSEFVRRYADRPGFTTESARLAWNQAADTHAAVLTVVADLSALQAEALPFALQDGNASLSTFPNWNNLFQAGDLCECEHCRSVLGPAAYFADLLMFLRDRKAANSTDTVKDVLFRRRPDLGFLELNCANALTPLPYVDVVCEVLEAVVDEEKKNDLELAGFTTMPADPATAEADVAAALSTKGVSLGADFTLSQVGTADQWVAHGDDATYLLKKKTLNPPSSNYFAEILRNTKASAAELRAYPQYVNPNVYDKLREAKYPMTLPFDLFAEEVRAAVRKTNLQRWDLMRTLRGSNPNNPTDGEVAAEYFGISVASTAGFDEKRLILEAAPTDAEQQVFWGEPAGADWLDRVGNVKAFLQKTRLEYNELLALLDLEFINPKPNRDIAVHHLDDSCDTAQKLIQVLDAAKLDRIHRFLRLWRKLGGWQMSELDLAIRRLGGALDELFLINLFYLSEVRAKLGGKTTVEQALALFGDLNTETRFTRLHEKRADGLYQQVFLDRRLIQPLDSAFEVAAVDVSSSVEKISGHLTTLLAALGIREKELNLLKGLEKASDNTHYVTGDDLTLKNLSFLWRHAWLSKRLKLKTEDWKIALKILPRPLPLFNTIQEIQDFLGDKYHIRAAGLTPTQLNQVLVRISHQDLGEFACPKSAYEFLETIDHIRAAGFTADELNWLLAADRSSRAATKEADAARFLLALRKELQAIQTGNDPAQVPAGDVEKLTALLTSLLQRLNRDEPAAQLFISILRDEVSQEKKVPGLDSVDFSAVSRIAYAKDKQTLRFTGLMTTFERTSLLNDVSIPASAQPDYQAAIEEFFNTPRLALKFFEPVFTAPLGNLPSEVDFKTLSDPALTLKISYDAEQRLLRSTGILSTDEKAALEELSTDASYGSAVNSLFTQSLTGAFPPEKLWLQEADLFLPVLAAKTNLTNNLATAAKRALAYLSRTLSENAVVRQVSAQLGLTEALTRRLLTQFAVQPPILPQPAKTTLLAHLTGPFSATTGAVDYDAMEATFDGWFWANRVAVIWKKWKITLEELERLLALPAKARVLDFLTLHVDDAGFPASLEKLLRASRLLRMRDSLPENGITLLGVLEKLSGGSYTEADFTADVERLNDAWPAADVAQLVASLNLAYPDDYLLAETWERLRRAFYFLDNLNAGASIVKEFAAATMEEVHAKALKDLLRSKFGAEAWLTLSAEIQDVLRERKRDALAAYLLTQDKPTDAPSGKWENTDDLYAYYLLDVEMGACQLTSRLVGQGSGSVQLFVQRCFMGLEPGVVVNAGGETGDSAWRWWKWMRKYRVWEANRKVFLWPENWTEPELRKEKSQFFRDLENQLLQNEINQENVETAFTSYLEKLDGVAQLEVAGFYQEDDGDDAILHVFGRTTGAEPHLYYYRRYDYRRWTFWEKVDLDIQSDYLIPMVVNKRLFLFWPVFTETPDGAGNSKVQTPTAGDSSADVPETSKRLKLQMAMGAYQQGKWKPKKVSTDAYESWSYTGEIVKNRYRFWGIDSSEVNGRIGIQFSGHGEAKFPKDRSDLHRAGISGGFELSGCRGVPELTLESLGNFEQAVRPELKSAGGLTASSKWVELAPRWDAPEEDFTLQSTASLAAESQRFVPVLMQTPGIFKMTPPWHLSYLDKLGLDGQLALSAFVGGDQPILTAGSWLPFFYNDPRRTFFVLPSLAFGKSRSYYPDIKKNVRQLEDYFKGLVQHWIRTFDLSALPPDQRRQFEQFLAAQFPEMPPPPYTDGQSRDLMKRYFMRFFHSYLSLLSRELVERRRFHFKNFYHPFVCDFAKLVYNPLQGIPGLMRRETQLQDSGFSFKQVYQPTPWVVEPPTVKFYPREVVDFSPDGAYSPYNWELFFHAPLLIANSLSRNQRFEEAREWYHFMFNPLGLESATPGGSPTSKYWITKPFYEATDKAYIQQRVENILLMLAGDTSVPGSSAQLKEELQDQVRDWRTNPFEPHRIASYRTVAYQKTVVMRYLDNLIAWGDYLFRQDSMESINEATQLYVLAAEILGPRPRQVPPRVKPPVESFNELETQLDSFSNALVQVENLIPQQSGNNPGGADPAPLPTLYFCIPHNEKMLGYWDTVADRLFKIRHCMNIEGVVRQLALFEPPIDPGALVKAVAAGVDISTALADLNAPLPLYRFNMLLQKANEVCSDVKALGGALLAALEKKDAEALGLLRQTQEIRLLEAVKAVREKQIEEAKENLEGSKRSKVVVETRRDYYRNIERLISQETLHLDKLTESHKLQEIAQGIKLTASIISILPEIDLGASGFGGSPHATFIIGGLELGQAAGLAADVLSFLSQIATNDAAMASSKASFDRRWDDWKLQERLAERELDQFDRQIAAAELRIAIAEKELENQVLQIENSKATDDFMRAKYTNMELYQWQVGQISGVYFQSYRLVYDLAKRAERCFRFELGLQDSSYINFGYWDSLKKGLLAGEKLQYDLRRLETAYLEQNRREFELTKHVSLALLDPLALVKLRETGRCFFSLPEAIFDLDYSGHYFRRIKSVSLTMPCVVGPYTTISCTLRLLKSSLRINTANGGNGYPRNTDDQGLPADDDRFIENNIPVKASAASNAQNDSGLFELSFRDERYLPFEGAGAISEWSLELFSDMTKPDFGKPLRQFDYRTISDVILHVKYTAREDVGPFKNGAVAHLREYLKDETTPTLRLFNLRQEFPSQWHRFLHPTDQTKGNVFELEMSPSLFQFRDVDQRLHINTIWLLARCTGSYKTEMNAAEMNPPGPLSFALAQTLEYGDLRFEEEKVSVLLEPTSPPAKWEMKMTRTDEGNLEVEDVFLVVRYDWEEP